VHESDDFAGGLERVKGTAYVAILAAFTTPGISPNGYEFLRQAAASYAERNTAIPLLILAHPRTMFDLKVSGGRVIQLVSQNFTRADIEDKLKPPSGAWDAGEPYAMKKAANPSSC
jgi:hypothetical protein